MDRERELVQSMTPEELFDWHRKKMKRQRFHIAWMTVAMLVQCYCLWSMHRWAHFGEKIKAEIIESNLSTAKKLDDTQYKIGVMKDACGIERDLRKN